MLPAQKYKVAGYHQTVDWAYVAVGREELPMHGLRVSAWGGVDFWRVGRPEICGCEVFSVGVGAESSNFQLSI